MIKTIVALAGGLTLVACVAAPEAAPAVARPIPFRTGGGGVGLGAVLGKTAGQLVGLFGQPNAEVREGPGRKLQFAGAICVLDAYLYPRGQAQPVVTYVDARETDGSPIDKASCVAALQRRSGGK